MSEEGDKRISKESAEAGAKDAANGVTKADVKGPTRAPSKAATKAPAKEAAKAPAKEAAKAPAKAATKAPAKAATKAPAKELAADATVLAELRAGIQPAVRGIFEPSVEVRSVPLARVLAPPPEMRTPPPEPATSTAARWQVPRLALPITVEPVVRTAGGAPEIAVLHAAPVRERSAQSGSRPAQSGSRPAQLGTRPAQPGSRPAQPGSRPAQPGSRPAQPGSRPAQPGSRPAQPGSRPAQERHRTPDTARGADARSTPDVATGRGIAPGTGWGDAALAAPGGYSTPGARTDTWLEELLHAQAFEGRAGSGPWWLPEAPHVLRGPAVAARLPAQSEPQAACLAIRVLRNEDGVRFRSEGGAREALLVLGEEETSRP